MPYEEITVQPAVTSQQNELAVQGQLDATRPSTLLRLESGRSVVIPTELLLRNLSEQAAAPVQTAAANTWTRGGEQVIPIIAEEAIIGKETVTTGTVRLHRGSETFTETVGLPLTRTTWDVERIPVGQLYTERPEIRQEGDVMVYPLVEERLVAKREYFLLEEVRVRRVDVTTDRTASVDLRRDTLAVERVDAVGAQAETPDRF